MIKYMNRTFSNCSTNSESSSVAFSECNSDRSGEFTVTAISSQLNLGNLPSTTSDLYSDSVVDSLIADLSDESGLDTQLRAARDLRLLAKHSPENRIRIARAGAVRPLVVLISSPNREVQEQGVTAILNLSLCEENASEIASAGAIRGLIIALKTGTSIARENAAIALQRLGQSADLRAAIGLSGAIPPLVSLLETGSLRGKKDAATALYTLCSSSKENKTRAVQAGIIRSLLEMMADEESRMVDKAAYVLAAVIGVSSAKKKVVEEDGIPVLVEILETGNHKQKEIVVDLLLQICQESGGYQSKVVKEGALPSLIGLSQSGTSRARNKVNI